MPISMTIWLGALVIHDQLRAIVFILIQILSLGVSRSRLASISQSSIKVEYRALANTNVELQWLQSLLKRTRCFCANPTYIVRPPQCNIFHINSNFYACTKHIEIDIHFACDKVASKNLLVCFIYTKYQKADIFTN